MRETKTIPVLVRLQSQMQLIILLILCNANRIGNVNAELTLSGPTCGVLVCEKNEYCSSFDNQCNNCADICDNNTHNFDGKLCVASCQDYLHDIRYVQVNSYNPGAKSSPPGNNNATLNNSKDIDKLYKLVTTTLTLLILLILANVAYCVYKCYNWAKKNDINANNFLNYFHRKRETETNEDVEKGGSPNGVANSNASTVTPKRDLRLHITNAMPNSEHPTATTPATMTTSISRRPAEDSALDYAYDNPAMSAGTPSPHSGKTPRESNF